MHTLVRGNGWMAGLVVKDGVGAGLLCRIAIGMESMS